MVRPANMGIYEILNSVNVQDTKAARINEIRKHGQNKTLMLLIKMAFDDGLKWRLPYGTPRYTPSANFDQQGMFYSEMRRMYLFVDLPSDQRGANIKPMKREQLFIDLLETLHPADAKILLAVKDKEIPKLYNHITKKFVLEALPGLLS